MVNSISHTGLVVRDLERAIVFYEGLGLVLWKRMVRAGPFTDAMVGIQNVKLEWAKMHAPDGSEVELIQHHSHPDYSAVRDAPSNRLGCSHVAFVVDDLATACYQVRRLGGSVENFPAPEWKSVYCHDPDGIIVEFVKA